MMNLIEANQQLFSLGGLLLVVVTFWWVLQWALIRYSKTFSLQAKSSTG